MYDMTGFDYDITDVANLLRLHKRRGNYYDCPFCGDTKGRLNINPAKNVFRCNRCDKSGGMLQLYADLHNLTYREANEEIREALNKGEYRQVRQAKVQEEKEEPVQSKLAPLDERHRTYTELLDRLPLYSVHRENLRSRGLTIEQIKERRYRSVPMYGLHKIAETLQESGCVLEGVPGFYRDPEERWTLNFKTKNSGFLVPVESMDGKIQACQIRLDHPRDNNKYLWFSSAGYPHGVSSGSPVHVIGDLDAENVYLTEGGLKGSIAHYLSGHTFICLAGVNMYRSLRPMLEEFQQRKMKFLFEAFD
ncbi:CHC2 zinc finger domain-containing protein, partial [[Clostridium] scindens]|uniref:CHC2 zinc finger domain-containing protein n=1 Tax=Clostridium scindens (strain JCM 10418 / VPI 12708) TaxID=29347 RepID=UPI001D084382